MLEYPEMVAVQVGPAASKFTEVLLSDKMDVAQILYLMYLMSALVEGRSLSGHGYNTTTRPREV
jgi:hypothetical protein